jgi:hypothetical protein
MTEIKIFSKKVRFTATVGIQVLPSCDLIEEKGKTK